MASTAMFAPYDPASAMARRIVAPITGNAYQIDPRGSALVDSSDVAWFQTQGFSATPTASAGQSLMYAPYMADEGMTGPTTNPNTGNTYFINAAGAVAVATADVAWFQTQGYALVPTPGTGFSLMSTQVEVGQALSGPLFSPITGNMYVMNGQGWIVAATADVAWLQGQGFAPVASGGVAPPIFPPNISGTQATIAADFAGQRYWASAATQASFAAWLTAIGGTYSRPSSATYLQGGVVKTAAANAPRFPTDASGVPQGLRLTGAATNLAIQSNNFTDAAWVQQAASKTGGVIAGPDGVASSASSIVPTAVAGAHLLYNTVAVAAGTMVASAFFKASGYGFGCVCAQDATGVIVYGVVADLSTGAITSTNNIGAVTGQSSGAIKLANGWVLIWAAMTSAAGSGAAIFVGASNVAVPTWDGGWGAPSFTGDGVSGVDVFGGQVTNTTFPVDYIPTTTATVTQAADTFQFPFTQTTFSVLAGTVDQQPNYGGTIVGSGGAQVIGTLVPTAFFIWTGANQVNGPALTGSFLAAHKGMVAGSPAGLSITGDGLTPVTGAFAIVSATPTTLSLAAGGGANSYGDITQLAIWNGLVASTAEMQRLTT